MRIAVVTNGNAFAAMMVRPLAVEGYIAGAAIVSLPPGGGSRLVRLARLARRTGVRYAGFKAGTMAIPVLRRMLTGSPTGVGGLCRAAGVPVLYTESANAPEAVTFLRSLEPEVLLSVSAPERLDDEVLAIPSRAAINIHWAPLPRYGGVAPYLWVLADGEDATAVTVHLMEPELDAGPVLGRRMVGIEPGDTALGLQLRLARAGGSLLCDILGASELPPAVPQDRTQRSYFSWPSAADVRVARGRGHPLVRFRDLADLWFGSAAGTRPPARPG